MNGFSPIRVMLVDDQEIVRLGLAAMLKASEGVILVGEAADGESAIELCGKVTPDVVLMDMVMPGMDGIAAIRAIHQQYPTVRVIVVSSLEEEKQIREAIKAGAVGYLLKNITPKELALAIHTVVAGLDAVSPMVMKLLLRSSALQPGPSNATLLTEREKEVLTLMIEGFGNPQIAKQLVVGPATVKSHVSNILSKLNVTSRTEAVTVALRQQSAAH